MHIQARDFMTPAWAVIGLGLVLGGSVGIYEMFFGHLFATNSALVWTLPLVVYVFLALASTGVSLILAFGLITKNPVLEAETRPLLIIAIGLLMGAFTALATELGSLLNMIWIILSPNPSSPIWWMGTLYSIELALLAIKLVMNLQGRHGVLDRPLAIATLVVAIAAAFTIGAVFGMVVGRPDYYGTFLSLVTLTAAVVSGAAAITLLRDQDALGMLTAKVLRAGAAFLVLVVAIRLVLEAGPLAEGTLGWARLWMLIPFVAVALFIDWSPRVFAGVALLGALGLHYGFIITGQLVSLGPAANWFGAVQTYQPNLPEFLILVLGIAVAAALIKLGQQVLTSEPEAAE